MRKFALVLSSFSGTFVGSLGLMRDLRLLLLSFEDTVR